MQLRCPHCRRRAEHVRSDFLGDWVVCPVCRRPFVWRQPEREGEEVRVAADVASESAIEDES